MISSCAQIGFYVFKILEDKKLKQREIAALLDIAQPDVSHLMNGHYSRFTTDKLLEFLKRLDQKVTIQIEPHKPGEPYREVEFATLPATHWRHRLVSIYCGTAAMLLMLRLPLLRS